MNLIFSILCNFQILRGTQLTLFLAPLPILFILILKWALDRGQYLHKDSIEDSAIKKENKEVWRGVNLPPFPKVRGTQMVFPKNQG